MNRAVIQAGGRGDRLRPFTDRIPKPILPLGPTSALELLLQLLSDHGILRVTILLNYLGPLIQDFVGNGRRWNLLIDFVTEQSVGGTAGGLREVPDLDGTFLLINGDIVTDIDLTSLVATHQRLGAAMTLAVSEQKLRLPFGVCDVDEHGYLTSFREKPEVSVLRNMGIYVLNRSVLQHVPARDGFGCDQLIHSLLKAGNKVARHPCTCEWMDIGSKESLEQASEVAARIAGSRKRNAAEAESPFVL
jgi:NDP-mannose synthase